MNFFYTSFAQITQGINDLYVAGGDLENEITALSIRTVTISAIALVILTLIAALLKDHAPKLKLPIFIMMAFTMIGSFTLLAGATVYLNVKSDSGGPVHWHADLEYWVCGNQLELRNPIGALSNKIGTAVLHEHDDQRIHLEGVVVDGVKDASLGKFMHVIDGAITDEALVLPLNAKGEGDIFEDNVDGDGENAPNPSAAEQFIVEQGSERFIRATDGQSCADGDAADVQVFVFKYNEDDKTYTQTKLTRPQDYIITDDQNIPPGDCIVVEFGPTRDYTDKLCEQYEVRDIDRCIANGVDVSQTSICEIRDVTDYSSASVQQTNDGSAASDRTGDATKPDDFDDLCRPFFNADGTATGIEIAILKNNGEVLNVASECAQYQAGLIDGTVTQEAIQENEL